MKFLINTCFQSEIGATIKTKSLLMIPQSLQFILFCVHKMILYQIVVKISKRLFLSMTWRTSLMRRTSWPLYNLVVVLVSTLKLLQKSNRSTESWITFPDLVRIPSAFPATINITVFFYEQHISNIFPNP